MKWDRSVASSGAKTCLGSANLQTETKSCSTLSTHSEADRDKKGGRIRNSRGRRRRDDAPTPEHREGEGSKEESTSSGRQTDRAHPGTTTTEDDIEEDDAAAGRRRRGDDTTRHADNDDGAEPGTTGHPLRLGSVERRAQDHEARAGGCAPVPHTKLTAA